MQNLYLSRLLTSLQKGYKIDRNGIKQLLSISDPSQINQLFEAAQNIRTKHFGNKIFLYGFLYFSTYCRNNCSFCQYRRSNKKLPRYRKTEEQILIAAKELADTGVHLIDLTMGEDPELTSLNQFGFSQLTTLTKKIRQKINLPVMISPGVIPDTTLAKLAEIGITWYACYQETHNRELYAKLRSGQEFNKRIEKKQLAKKYGMLIEEGILTGVVESLDDLADSIIWMRDFSVDQARVMTFVPQAGTPMAKIIPQNSFKEQMIIAVLRLVLGDVLIPASLDVGGLDGVTARLNAGANVVTSIVPPKKGLAGVANHSLDIDDSRRSLGNILPVLESIGLKAARPEEYRTWVKNRQSTKIKFHDEKLRFVC